jgi:hypothetical protein
MFEARQSRRENGRLPMGQYDKIACEFDRAGFKPVSFLERKHREDLAKWNKKPAQGY